MKIAIVGHAFDKFDTLTSYTAIETIRDIMQTYPQSEIISGESPMGGVDVWARIIAEEYGNVFKSYPPEVNQWDPPGEYGYKARNLDIASDCDILYNIVVRDYPKHYEQERYDDYHCLKHSEMKDHPHVKSGGCWTLWKAKGLGKRCHFLIIEDTNVKEVII